MIERKSTFFLGIFLFIIPFLGFPSFWKTFFVCVSGLTLVALSIQIKVPQKTIKTRIRKEKPPQSFDINSPMQPKPAKEVKSIFEENLDSEIQ